jgi:competence protein CoiA
MQLFALNERNLVVAAKDAQKQTDYQCLECQTPVRVRGGRHRQIHFYHLQSDRTCFLNQKSMAHIQTQLHLQSLFLERELGLEVRFPTIQRIADAVWFSKKIIFEVQCSPMTTLEAKARMDDYLKEGYRVVWVLHDHRYNQSNLSALERSLVPHPHYYTNINAEGQGMIYDQFSKIQLGKRYDRMDPLPVYLSRPVYEKESGNSKFPAFITNRLLHWPFFFEGDVVQCALNGFSFPLDEIQEVRKQTFFQKFFVRPYLLLFQLVLELACR